MKTTGWSTREEVVEALKEIPGIGVTISQTQAPGHYAPRDGIVVTFPNGWGASIVRNTGSYGSASGMWELAVLHEDTLCYRSSVTDDVIGWLDPRSIADLVQRIAEFSPKPRCTHDRPDRAAILVDDAQHTLERIDNHRIFHGDYSMDECPDCQDDLR